MKTLILGIPNLKEAENSQIKPTATSVEQVNQIVEYLGKRHCQVGDLDYLIFVDEYIYQTDREVIQQIIGDSAHIIFIEGDNVETKFTDENLSTYTLLNI